MARKDEHDLRIKNSNPNLKRIATNVAKNTVGTLSAYVRKLIREDIDKQPERYRRDKAEDDGC